MSIEYLMTEHMTPCPACQGSGYFDKDARAICGTCWGRGDTWRTVRLEDTEPWQAMVHALDVLRRRINEQEGEL